MARTEDEELVAALRRGEPDATAALYRRLYPIARRAVQRTTPSLRDQEDAVQTALERVHHTLASGRFLRACSLATWVAVIARNAAIDNMRARIREDQVFGSMHEARTSKANDLERTLLARSELHSVQRRLTKVDTKLASPVLLCDVLEMSVHEMATSLGLSTTAAHSRLRRGRDAIRRKAMRV